MAIAILNQSVRDLNTVASSYSVTGFNVPGGTTRLLVLIEYRADTDLVAPPISSVFHNTTDAVDVLFSNVAVGDQEINTWWGQRANPDIGTFNIDITFAALARGAKVWLLAISGEKSSGSILGVVDHQRVTSPTTPTVGLGLTPSAAGSLLLASLAMAQVTTLSSWTGTGFVEAPSGTGQFSYLGWLTSTSRYRLNAPVSVNTVSGTFAVSDLDIGGSLIEILAEAGSVDVAGDLAFGLSIVEPFAGVASARMAEYSYLASNTWTEIVWLQPDSAGVDRRIITAGPSTAPNYTLDMVTAGTVATNVYRWRYRLADGVVAVETGAGTQSTSGHVIALLHRPGNPTAFVNGIESVSSRSGNLRVGLLDAGSGGEAIGDHDQAAPSPFTGLIGRKLLFDGELTSNQIRLLTLSLMAPDSINGYGSENDAQVANRSPVAMPMLVLPDGRPSMTITPRTVDPDGTLPTITTVNQGTHTAVAISGANQLALTFERGWQGFDAFHYTVGDGSKFSTALVSIEQRLPALLARDDAITVEAAGTILFDPRINDLGAGPLRVISVSVPSDGTATIQPDGRILYNPN